jgi:uncharacterized protein YqhQ
MDMGSGLGRIYLMLALDMQMNEAVSLLFAMLVLMLLPVFLCVEHDAPTSKT